MTVAAGLANEVSVDSSTVTAGVPITVPWPVTNADEVLVVYNDRQVAVRGTHYSVTLFDPDYATAEVTPNATLVDLLDGVLPVIVRRNMGLSQQYDVSQLFNLPPVGLESSLDRIVLYIQQLQALLDRSIKLQAGVPAGGSTVPDGAATYLGLAADGTVARLSAPGTLEYAEFASTGEAIAATIPALQTQFRTGGYSTAGDGGGALYVRASSEPSHPGKLQNAVDNSWWEYVPGPEGVNVRAFGAVGGSAVDCSAAVANAWAYGWANPASADGYGVTLYFPAGDYLITDNDVLGAPGVTGQRRYGHLVGPGGMGGAKITLRPTTGNSTFGDNKYFLFDGGDGGGVNFNTFHPQFFRAKNLHFVLDKTNLTTGDEIWLWRMDGESASQNLELVDVRVTGTGSTGTGVDAESGFIQLVGNTNSSECVITNCRLQSLSHIAYSSNPQAVGLTLRDTHCLQIYDNFFEIDGGAAEIYLHGGGYIWADTPDNATQYLFSVDSSSGNPGSTTAQIHVDNIKTEMRHAGAALVNAPNTQGLLEVTFNKVNFTGGGVAADGDRDVTVLNSNKSVKFVDCLVPNAFGHEFLVENGARADENWTLSNLGLVEYLHSTYHGDLSAKITKTGDGGRVIAKDCKGYSAEASPYKQLAVDFDSNPFITGHEEPQPWLKEVKLVDESIVWNGDDDFEVILPHGAILDRVHAIRFPGTGATSRDLKITDGDAVELATDTSTELAGFDASADIDLSDVTGKAQRRTTTNKRTLTAGVTTTLTGNTANGRGYARYW